MRALTVHPSTLQVHYVLNTAPKGWTGGVGFITEEMIKWVCSSDAAVAASGVLCRMVSWSSDRPHLPAFLPGREAQWYA